MKTKRPRFSNSWTYLFLLLATLASSLPNYSTTTGFKVTLLLLSAAIIVISKSFISLKKRNFIFAYLLYFLYLLANINTFDNFTYRLIFNGVVTLASSYAATFLKITRPHLLFALGVVSIFSIYAFIFNINPIDGKPQVHAQIFSLIYLSTILFYGRSQKFLPAMLLIIVISKIRSAIFGYITVIAFSITSRLIHSKTKLLTLLIVISAMSFYVMMANLDYLTGHFGSHADSLRWRALHWGNIFSSFEGGDWIFGKGLGYSWRMSLNIDDFYATGKLFIASHSNYVKIISETGALGLLVFFCLIFYIYKKSSAAIQAIIVFYLGYGFFDEGVWHFDLFWLLALASIRIEKDNDFSTNYNQR